MHSSKTNARVIIALLLTLLVASAERARAQTESVLYSFCSKLDCGNQNPDGPEYPTTNLILDAKGNLYGTSNGGYGGGTVFEVTPLGEENVLYDFGSHSGDGGLPEGGLIRDLKGNLYGTTAAVGTVFELLKAGKTYTESVLYAFANGTGGAPYPKGSLVRDRDGNFYGVTYAGGSGLCYCGTVFKLSPDGTETTLYSFAGGLDGANSHSGLVLDAKGNLYGTTLYGGNPEICGYKGCGTIFEVSATGTEKVLYTFTNKADGANP
jgi:uncharacterized repeat protein (TIGR03803 family)